MGSKSNNLIFEEYYELIENQINLITFKGSRQNGKDPISGKMELINEKENCYKLSFNRVNSFLGYRKFSKLFRNNNGDFIKEEVSDSKTNELLYVLLNDYEYYESEIETEALEILNNGWQ